MKDSTGKFIASGAAITVALLALLPGAWGSALAQTAGAPTPTPAPVIIPAQTFTLSGSEEAVLQPAPSVAIVVPPGALPAGTTLSVASVDTSPENVDVLRNDLASLGITSLPPAADDGGLVLSVFNLEAALGGNAVAVDQPVSMTFDLTPEQLAAAGGDANNATLQFWDTQASPPAWTPVECSGAGTSVTCTLPHFSLWALTIAAPTASVVVPAPAPTGVGAAGSERSHATLLLTGAVALIGLAGLGARYAARHPRV
jgi:hypothetical protein